MKNRGIYFAIVTALISGFSIFVNKFAVDVITPPLLFTATKNSLVGIAIILLLATSGKWQKIKLLTRKDLFALSVIAVVGGALPFYLFFTGLSQVSAANSAFIQKTLVFWVALLAIPLLKEHFTKSQLFGVCLLFLANFTVGGLAEFRFSTGELMILSATLLWAIEYVVAKVVLNRVDPDIVTTARMGLGSLVLVAASLLSVPNAITHISRLSSSQLALLALTAITLLAYVTTWYRALKHAPVITVTAILVSSTLVTSLLSAIFVTRVWTVSMLLQAVLILTGVYLLTLLPTRPTPALNRN